MVLVEVTPTGHDWKEDWIVDIVAVHGFNEDYTSAWVDPKTKAFWLRDLLPRYLPSARILSYGYAADTFASPSEESSERTLAHATTLLAELEADRAQNNAEKRPLIFICHGVGGVLVKRALACASSKVSPKVAHLYSVYISTYGILFLGTPHDGIRPPGLDTLAHNAPGPQPTPSALLAAATKGSEALQNINDQFVPLMKQFHVHFFWEQKKTTTEAGSHLVVDEISAAPLLDDTERSGIWANHAQMCKFGSAEAPGFSVVCSTLQRYTKDANKVISNRWIQAIQTLQRLRNIEAAELLATGAPNINRPMVYPEESVVQRNKYYRVPYNASSIFTGRKDISKRLERSILSGSGQNNSPVQKRFVLYGLGGSGKTQFCLKFVQDHRQSFWGIFWIDASTVENAEQCFSNIAQIDGRGKSCDDGKDWLTSLEMSWMLVIDNADNPLVDVSRFFPAGDRGHILVTSRNKECRHLQTVGYEELKEMDHEEAVTLLLRSSDKDHNNPRYRNSARPIAKALGYLPLALDQAGAAIRQDICTLRNYLSVYNRHRKQVMGTRSIQGSEAYKYTVYTTWEVSFQMIKKLEKPASVDACEILQIFAFFHFQQVPASLLQRAWASALQATSSSVSVSLFSRILGLLSPAVDDNGITQSSQLLRRAGQSWDVIRFRRALSILAQFSMIARDADREEDSYQTPDDDRTSLRSYTAVSGNYSMHPLVHFWVRDRMDKADQNRWFEIATAALADSITADPDPAEHAYRRALIPHIDCFFNGEHTKPLIADQTNVRQLERAFNITQVYAEGGRWNSARELQERVVDERIALLGAEHDDTLAAMASLASTYWNSGLMDKVADLRRRVLDLKTRRFGSKDCRTLEAMDELAKAYWLCGRWAEAEALSLDAVNGMREVLGPTDPSVLTATLNLARLHKHKGRPEKGLAILARSRDDCLKEYGPEHALSLEATMELGMIYHAIGRFSEAESLLLGVLETRRRVLGKDHAYTLWAVNDLSKIYCSQGRAVEAEEMILAILDVVEETLGKEHVGMTMTMSNLARAYSTQGRFTDAEAVLDSLHDILARKISTGKIDPLHPDWLECLYKEARNYMQLGRVKDAERTYIEVIPMLEKKLGPEHPWTCNAKVRLEEIQKPLSPLTPVEQTAGM